MGAPHRRHRWRRIIIRSLIVFFAILFLLFAALVGIIFVPTHWPATEPITRPVAAVKHYYLALGDSLAFGFQPNFNWDQGYTSQWWMELQRHGSRSFMDYACNGETSDDFVHGGCPFYKVRHNYYSGPQLSAAVSFIRGHAGQVGPVSLDIGADDVIPTFNVQACTVDKAAFTQALSGLERRLTHTILPQLLHALTGPDGTLTGQLVMMNYYDPFARKCAIGHHYVSLINAAIARAAHRYHVPLADVYDAFGSQSHDRAHICEYTWMCGILQNMHPNTTGYAAIMGAFERAVGY